MMEYKGYTGRITALDENQGIIHGEVIGINDIITFQGKTSEELLQAFHDSVDDYLAFCEERSEAPEKPFSGKFLVRIPPSLHQQASLAAKKAGESLNAWVVSAIKAFLRKELPSPHPTRERPPERADIRSILELLGRSELRQPNPYRLPLEPDPLRSALAQLLLENWPEPSTRRYTPPERPPHHLEPEEEQE